MQEINLKYWLALIRSPLIGTQRFLKLERFFTKDISEIFATGNRKLIEKLLPKEALNYITNPDWKSVEQDLTWASKPNHHIITLHNPNYPICLREIPDPPPVLYIKGRLTTLNTKQIALVGTRNPSFLGQETAFQFAYQLAKENITITSGLARGIDSYGHQGALKADGQTIAVLGSGINCIYPKKHSALAEKISSQGAIVSEFPPETPPLAKHFPHRNRIISGLSIGVLVVEAAMQSGSLITARLANEQGREVFAIPGSIQNSFAKGCHSLIQQGAKLVSNINDILEEYNFPAHYQTVIDKKNKKPELHTENERKIWNSIDSEPTFMDIIALRSGLTIGEVSSILLSFEINDLIKSTPTGYIKII